MQSAFLGSLTDQTNFSRKGESARLRYLIQDISTCFNGPSVIRDYT